ncbi:MAG: TetR/AcrR family transcriptional regulator [Acidobacteriota bacterium]|nr:TetR/AcrR family transcriptional regulator [Acidobacteriota bacterium]
MMTARNGSVRASAQERILATAASLFAQFGYEGASTREIAAEAGVNEVTIYRHYARKRDLYLAVVGAELSRIQLRGELLSKLAEAPTGRDALICTFDLLVSTLQQSPHLLRLLHFSTLELNQDLDPLFKKHLVELVEVVARYLNPWIEKGELQSPDARSLILTLVAIVLSCDPLKRIFGVDIVQSTGLLALFSDLNAVRQVALS